MPARPSPRLLPYAAVCVIAVVSLAAAGLQDRPGVKRTTWGDVAPLHARLQDAGITEAAFAGYVTRVHDQNSRRVRDGDLDHLIFYLLQSTRFTRFPAIEPALSGKAVVDRLGDRDREAFLGDPYTARRRVPDEVRSRIQALLRAFDEGPRDARFSYFRRLVDAQFPDRRARADALAREYLRVMRFVYQKEFVAQRAPQPSSAVAELYRTRGLSTDTAVEAGFVVHLGLGVLRSLDPARRVSRILIAGPGLDLAPRTALDEESPPESYQPWAVMDAVLSLGLSSPDDLEVVAVDINPRVVEHLRRSRGAPPTLTLATEIEETGAVTFSDAYREYFARLGRTIGTMHALPPRVAADGRLRKTLRIHPNAARAPERRAPGHRHRTADRPRVRPGGRHEHPAGKGCAGTENGRYANRETARETALMFPIVSTIRLVRRSRRNAWWLFCRDSSPRWRCCSRRSVSTA